MKTRTLCLTSVMALCAAMPALADMNFNRVASFPVNTNLPEGTDPMTETSSEIITVSEDGMTLIYSDSPLGVIGLIDISDPANPQPAGTIELDGEPTAVSALGNTVFVGINTSESYTEPSGHLLHIDLASGEEPVRPARPAASEHGRSRRPALRAPAEDRAG